MRRRWCGWWWDDAVNVANRRAMLTGERQRIKRDRRGLWIVEAVA